MQFHECPERAITNMVKEALRLLRPGGTFAVTDNSVRFYLNQPYNSEHCPSKLNVSFLANFAAKVEDSSGKHTCSDLTNFYI